MFVFCYKINIEDGEKKLFFFLRVKTESNKNLFRNYTQTNTRLSLLTYN